MENNEKDIYIYENEKNWGRKKKIKWDMES